MLNSFTRGTSLYLIISLGLVGYLFTNSLAAAREFDQKTLLAEHDQLMGLYFAPEDLVETASRAPKPLNQVAENVTIVTAEQIERMNARSVAEILDRVPGVFVGFFGRDFNAPASLSIQDSDYPHVLVLVDGLRWNDSFGGMAVTNAIPVEIISRIEVVKGPGSSTWGSALGGVVNIITQKAGTTSTPTGRISASYGEADSHEVNATMAGKLGPAGYFLAVGSQESDGIMEDRFYERESVYTKVKLDLGPRTSLSLSSGYSEPEKRLFSLDDLGFREEGIDRNFWGAVTLEGTIGESGHMAASVYRKEQKYIRNNYTLPDGAFWFQYFPDNRTNGVSGLLSGQFANHLLVLGAEYERTETEDDLGAEFFDENWGVYVNDTMTFGSVNLIPGIRYDDNSLSDNVISPSLGLTWQITDRTLVRALAARGFRRPYNVDAAPDLDPELITSYQLGLETTALPFGSLKATMFNHHLKDVWLYDWTNYVSYNGGRAKRTGYEVELDTVPWHHLSASTSLSYVYTDYNGRIDNDDRYTVKVTLTFEHPELFTAELFGNYDWLNEVAAGTGADYGTMIWDLNFTSRRFKIHQKMDTEFFATVHNLFSGSSHWHRVYENAPRWLEAGLRFYF